VVITDFGIARGLSSDITRSGVIIGTPEYLSPEQVMVARLDHRTDIFSLGIVFYELLTGIHPFRDSDISKTIHAILNEQPLTIDPVIMKMIEKDRNARFQSCAEIAQLL
jgi:serine/threonine-protein kinase